MHWYRRYIVFSTFALLVLSGGVFLHGTGVTASLPREYALVPASMSSVPEPEMPNAGSDGKQTVLPEVAYPPSANTRLLVPALGIDATVVPVGISLRGNMAVPVSYSEIGWWRLGPAPGEAGNAVFAGHVDNGYFRTGVFKRLDEAKAGDRIYYQSGGAQREFAVTYVVSYPYDAAPREEIFREDGLPGLVLITCGGTWMPEQNTYTERVVVFAESVGG